MPEANQPSQQIMGREVDSVAPRGKRKLAPRITVEQPERRNPGQKDVYKAITAARYLTSLKVSGI